MHPRMKPQKTNKTKIILNQTLVDKAFNASAPKIQVTKTLEEHQ
jgi:hypothetical protein